MKFKESLTLEELLGKSLKLITNKELASLINRSESVVSVQLHSNMNTLSLRTVYRYCSVLGVRLSFQIKQ